jgi:hypothetical protein
MNGNIIIKDTSDNLKNILAIAGADTEKTNMQDNVYKVIIFNHGTEDIWINTLGDAVVGKGGKVGVDMAFEFSDTSLEDLNLICENENSDVGIIIM